MNRITDDELLIKLQKPKINKRPKIEFMFDDKLQFQLDAVSSVIRLFENMPIKIGGIYEPAANPLQIDVGGDMSNNEITAGERLLENMRAVQLDNELFPDSEVTQGNNFTIEMETGTGKTYVYLRTILELHKTYGFKKFMIVVPSVAIRIGVEKSIEMLNGHFKALYNGIELSNHSFAYNGDMPKQVSSKLVESSDIAICVLNIQSFNKTTNKLRIMDENGHILWEDIKAIRPIVIIDEPQKVEGSKKSKSKSLQAIEGLNPLFVLRYSATHKNLYNLIYKLNSHDAYSKNLVKQIWVKTVNGVIPKDYPYIRYMEFTNDFYAKIEIFIQKQGFGVKFATFKVRGGASVFDLSGGLPQYSDYYIAEDPHKKRPLIINTKNEPVLLTIGHSNYEVTEDKAIRVQIALAIESHFMKQAEIFAKKYNIKVLTLFFVDSVSKVRDNSAQDGRGEYLRIFDEEYIKFVKGQKFNNLFGIGNDNLSCYKAPEMPHLVREGYFAIDKHRNFIDISDWDSDADDGDVKVSVKSQEDIDRGIELILKKKDELISFEEPLSFIFSHSALREGWDNPNVFTICALKRGGTEISKKQEIGRGLRLPVDTNGLRCTDTNINELTVIANEHFAHFAENLQKDFNEVMGFNKDEVTPEILSATLVNAGLPPDKITPKLISNLQEELFMNSIINIKNILNKRANELIDNINFTYRSLREHEIMIIKEFKKRMAVKGSKRINIFNGDNRPVKNSEHSYVSEDDFKDIYNRLMDNLAKRTIYKLKLDKDKFICECIDQINILIHRLKNNNEHRVVSAAVKAEESGRFGMGETSVRAIKNQAELDITPKSDFEIANIIMHHTNLPRMAIFKILSGISEKKILSNQDALLLAIKEINAKLIIAKAKHITSYEVVKGYLFDEKIIFETDNINEEMLEIEKRVYVTNESMRSAVNKYYYMDKPSEYSFAKRLDEDENVLLFTKLKKGGFVIDTPYGNYTPDWALVYKHKDGDLKLYYIVETKFKKEWGRDLSDEEMSKIKSGRLHFEAVNELSNDNIAFLWANSYEDFEDKV